MPAPGKNFPGQKGYPTPNNAPEEQFRRVFILPNSEEWLGLLMGAVQLLTEEWRYYEWGELTPAESAAAFNQIILAAYDGAGENMPAPYWDTTEDVDDEAPAETQMWYGEVEDPEAPPGELTFQENAAIWLVTGFLAFATLEVAAAPAIFFHSIAPRFVLALRRGDIGKIVRVIVDAVEYGRIDTSDMSEGDIVDVPIVADPELDGHDIYIVQVD